MESKIYSAIPKIMSDIGAIGKEKKNVQQNYQFRGIDDIYNAAQGALVTHGVFCVPEVLEMTREQLPSKSGGTLLYTILKVRYTFFAEDGSSIGVIAVGEAMDSGDKSCNKAMSAAHKYAFLQLFCIPTVEPKDSEIESHEIGRKSDLINKNGKIETVTKTQPAPMSLGIKAAWSAFKSTREDFGMTDEEAKAFINAYYKDIDPKNLTVEQINVLTEQLVEGNSQAVET